MQNKKNQKGLPKILIEGFLVVIFIGGLLFFFGQQNGKDTKTQSSQSSQSNWTRFISQEYTIAHHFSIENEPQLERTIQFSITYPPGWEVIDGIGQGYPLVLKKDEYVITIQSTDNQTAQLCEAYEQAKNGKKIQSAYAQLFRMQPAKGVVLKTPFISNSTITQFVICAEDQGPGGHADITQIGRILFDAPEKYNQATIDQMDAIISTLTPIRLTGFPFEEKGSIIKAVYPK